MPSYRKYAVSVGLPRAVQCSTCKRSKDIEEFAPAEQRSLSRLMAHSGRVPDNHGAQCKLCRNAPRPMTCYACNRDLEEKDFSKLQHKKDEPICLQCVAWEETQGPGYTPTPCVNGHRSVEEEPDIVNRQQKTDVEFYPDADGDDDTSAVQISKPGPVRLGGLGQEVSNLDVYAGRSKRGSRTYSSIPTVSTATTVRDGESVVSREAGESFNGWDSRGVRHRQLKDENSSIASTDAGSIQETPNQSVQTSRSSRKSKRDEEFW